MNITEGGTIRIKVTIEDQNPAHRSVYDNEVVALSLRHDFGAADSPNDVEEGILKIIADAGVAAMTRYEEILKSRAAHITR
jgi:hypothetical protein